MTRVLFQPSPISAFQFPADLDGETHNVVVTWNISSRRWYISVFKQTGERVLSIPLVGSAPYHPISLVGGYFSSTLTYTKSEQIFEILP